MMSANEVKNHRQWMLVLLSVPVYISVITKDAECGIQDTFNSDQRALARRGTYISGFDLLRLAA